MSRQYWSSPVGPMHAAAGASYNTSVTITDVSPGGLTNPIEMPGSALDLGSVIRINAWGTYAVSATTPTIILGFYYGGVAGTALAVTAATAVTNSATVNWPWRMYWEGMVTATGTSGAILGNGWWDLATSLTATTHLPRPATAPASVTIDTTVQKAVTTGATWGASAAANILFCNFMSVELLG